LLHLSVLIETMRREGYELQVGQPQVIIKELDGVKCEPVEQLTVFRQRGQIHHFAPYL
jgi:GTP-binding protein